MLRGGEEMERWEEMGEIVDFSLRGMAWRDVAFLWRLDFILIGI
jgi:hypothetical protein